MSSTTPPPPSRIAAWSLALLAGALPAGADTQPDSIRSLDTLRVTDTRLTATERTVVAREEEWIGVRDDVFDILHYSPGVLRVGEARSSLLVRGEGSLDNVYLVYGVPLWAPSHFANHSWADRAGPMIATVENVTVVRDHVAGRYPWGASAVIALDPGIARSWDERRLGGPQLTLNYGTYDMDFSLAAPLPDTTNVAQVSWRATNDYLLAVMAHNMFVKNDSTVWLGGALENVRPSSWSDVSFSGEHQLAHCRLRHFIWYARDEFAYGKPDSNNRFSDIVEAPWGMAAAQMDGARGSRTWAVSLGGGIQHWFEGKEYGRALPYKHARHAVGSAVWEWRVPVRSWYVLDLTLRGEYQGWHDSLTTAWRSFPAPASSTDSTSRQVAAGDEVRVSASIGNTWRVGRLDCGVNTLAGAIGPTVKTFVDPGLWLRLNLNRSQLRFTAGMRTTQPDTRGLPSASYRAELGRAMDASVGAEFTGLPWLRLLAEGYAKRRDRCPSYGPTPGALVWDPEAETGLLAYGGAGLAAVSLGTHVKLRSVLDIGRSRRMVGDRYEPFEYDIPWCSRNTLQVSGKGNRHTFALTVLAAAGLPYQDITTGSGGTQQWGAWQRTKTYQRVDVRYALHQQLPGHPLLRRLDIYVDLRNLLYLVDYFSSTYSEDSWHTFDNAVEYVWAADGRGEPLYMNDWALVLGLRGYFGVERRQGLQRRHH